MDDLGYPYFRKPSYYLGQPLVRYFSTLICCYQWQNDIKCTTVDIRNMVICFDQWINMVIYDDYFHLRYADMLRMVFWTEWYLRWFPTCHLSITVPADLIDAKTSNRTTPEFGKTQCFNQLVLGFFPQDASPPEVAQWCHGVASRFGKPRHVRSGMSTRIRGRSLGDLHRSWSAWGMGDLWDWDSDFRDWTWDGTRWNPYNI